MLDIDIEQFNILKNEAEVYYEKICGVRCPYFQKEDDGERFFYNLIPYWGTDKQGNRILHSGNPEED